MSDGTDKIAVACELCGARLSGSSHYHCPNCGCRCSMMGHYDPEKRDYTCTRSDEPKVVAWRAKHSPSLTVAPDDAGTLAKARQEMEELRASVFNGLRGGSGSVLRVVNECLRILDKYTPDHPNAPTDAHLEPPAAPIYRLVQSGTLHEENGDVESMNRLAVEWMKKGIGSIIYCGDTIIDTYSDGHRTAPDPTADAGGDAGRLEKHTYFPDYQNMGDCSVCGHVEDSPVHIQSNAGGDAVRACDNFVGGCYGNSQICMRCAMPQQWHQKAADAGGIEKRLLLMSDNWWDELVLAAEYSKQNAAPLVAKLLQAAGFDPSDVVQSPAGSKTAVETIKQHAGVSNATKGGDAPPRPGDAGGESGVRSPDGQADDAGGDAGFEAWWNSEAVVTTTRQHIENDRRLALTIWNAARTDLLAKIEGVRAAIRNLHLHPDQNVIWCLVNVDQVLSVLASAFPEAGGAKEGQ